MRSLVLLCVVFAANALFGSDVGSYYVWKGSEAMKEGDYDNALQYFTKAIKIAPDTLFAYNNRGNVLALKGEYERARADFDKAIAMDPDFSEAYMNRGRLHQSLGEDEAALQDYGKAIETAPRSWKVYSGFRVDVVLVMRGSLYFHDHRFAEAKQDFDRAVELKPKEPRAYYYRGLVYTRLGDLDHAIADFDAAVRNGERGYVELWRYVFGQNIKAPPYDLRGAMRHWSKRNPWQLMVGHYLAGDLSEEQFFAAAKTGQDTVGQECEAYFYSGMKRVLSGDLPAARKLFERCLETHREGFSEYYLAKAELAQLSASETTMAAPAAAK